MWGVGSSKNPSPLTRIKALITMSSLALHIYVQCQVFLWTILWSLCEHQADQGSYHSLIWFTNDVIKNSHYNSSTLEILLWKLRLHQENNLEFSRYDCFKVLIFCQLIWRNSLRWDQLFSHRTALSSDTPFSFCGLRIK